MNYEYTKTNRLDQPHNYMYSKYNGNEFLHNYFDDRMNSISRFSNMTESNNFSLPYMNLFKSSEEFIENTLSTELHQSDDIETFIQSIDSFKTEEILMMLISHLCFNNDSMNIKNWIDFLVQRFEVTKKLSEFYFPKKIKKGAGDNKNVSLYVLFSLLLIVYFKHNKNIKYLNTLLKINDLICSLDNSQIELFPGSTFVFLIENELDIVKTFQIPLTDQEK